MGTWGAGIYEEDSARDYIDGIIKNLSNAVKDIMRWDYTLLHPGMPQSSLVLCHIDMLYAICSRNGLYTSLPETQTIKKWKAKYMEVWNFCIDECHPSAEHKTQRAKILRKSFNDLIALAEKRDNEYKTNSEE